MALKNPDDVDVKKLSEFQFSALEKELIIGPVFVRVFNEQDSFCVLGLRHFYSYVFNIIFT